MNCPDSGSVRAAFAGIMARSMLNIICSKVPGLTCNDSARVVVKNFCGTEYDDIEAKYSSGSRRLTTSGTSDAIVDFVFTQQSLDSDTLRTLEGHLSSYLQGSTLSTFLSLFVANVLASNPPLSMQTLTAAYLSTFSAFISGLGRYYPAWGVSETCLSVSIEHVLGILTFSALD